MKTWLSKKDNETQEAWVARKKADALELAPVVASLLASTLTVIGRADLAEQVKKIQKEVIANDTL